jgi:SAM-dependent methyltransferase
MQETQASEAALASSQPVVHDAEFHVWECSPDDVAMDRWVAFWSEHLAGRRILDVGCGEGHLLRALLRAGYRAEGVDLNPALVERARHGGAAVACGDALQFVRERRRDFEAFVMCDFVEHVPFHVTQALLEALPVGAVCVLQTPNTDSIIGHQFYLQVPSHITPLSPFVLEKMFARHGIRRCASGTEYGGLPWTGLRRSITQFILVKLLGTVTTRLLSEGGNYYLVGIKDGLAPRP